MVFRFHIFAFPAGSAREYFPGLLSLDAAVASQLLPWTLDIPFPSIGKSAAKKFQCLEKCCTKDSGYFHPSDFNIQNSTFKISSAFQFPLHCRNVEG
jgi:hypothetical protein